MIDWYQVYSEQVQTLNQYRLGTMRGPYGEGEREREGEGKLRNVSLALLLRNVSLALLRTGVGVGGTLRLHSLCFR